MSVIINHMKDIKGTDVLRNFVMTKLGFMPLLSLLRKQQPTTVEQWNFSLSVL